MTHRSFSRNAASSRAIPVAKMIAQVLEDPAMPVYWGSNKPGMQAGAELDEESRLKARAVWLEARDAAVLKVGQLVDLGLHKQIANRILEPWMHMVTIITATEWENFYSLRTDAAAQPEFKALADAMLVEHNVSTPIARRWHLPFVTNEEMAAGVFGGPDPTKLCVARCARVSYLNHDGTNPDVEKDLQLHDRLLASGHMSPFEHAAEACPDARFRNFVGWRQYRAMVGNDTRSFPGLIQKGRS